MSKLCSLCSFRYLFYAESARPAKIYRCSLDASDCEIIKNTSMARPVGLSIDFTQDQLCYGDSVLGFIACMNLDGTNSRTLQVDPRPYPTGLAVLGGRNKHQIKGLYYKVVFDFIR